MISSEDDEKVKNDTNLADLKMLAKAGRSFASTVLHEKHCLN